jgi:plasmid maintenance system antidote protein VapI
MQINLANLAFEKFVTHRNLALEIGIPDSHLSRILNRHIMPDRQWAVKIAKALGKTVDELWPVEEK